MLGVLVLFTVGVIAALAGVGYIVAIAATGPDIGELKPIDKGESSAIYAADGSLLGYVQSDVVRQEKPFDYMPVDLRQATVAIEDQRFYEHGGVDPEGIVRAALKNITSGGKTVQGGSTITQQLVRALYIQDPQQNIKRKIREAKLAQELEDKHSKRWILEQYLNDVPYGTVGGRTALGAEAASQVFFAKHAKDLTLGEAAMIAGLPQAPSEYNPFQQPQAALERRNEVLQKMADNKFISQPRADAAMQKGLGLKRGTLYTRRREPYFFDYVEQLLIERYGAAVYRQGGLKVYTTIDPKKQQEGRQAIDGILNQTGDPSSAVVSIDPSNGYIEAMASSGTYNDRTFNLAAQGHRQPGSSFKTMVLTTAVREGVDPAKTYYTSKPLQLQIPGYGTWKVKTYDGTYGGNMDLVHATLKSDNSVYAQLDVDLGPKKIAQTAHDMGITTHLDGVPSEGLGGLRLGVSPLEMADAYATLASGGVRHRPIAIRKVTFRDGKSENLGKTQGKRVFSDGVAYEVTKILEQNVQRGTGIKAAALGCPAAGKTGTTDNFNDAWFVGYTPDLASAVWVGYPKALKEMRNVHGIEVAGGTFPTEIWTRYMLAAHGSDCREFPQPTTPFVGSAFHGEHAGTGKQKDNLTPGGGSGTSAGGGGYRGGYDPRLYASPPQAPPSTKAPTGKGGGGKGGGKGGGGKGGGGKGGGGKGGGGTGTGTGGGGTGGGTGTGTGGGTGTKN
ncbi:MAG: penicillin-binding protein [Thermoleophilaceae bacterium]|nr:penicillin-binding protein [Thermoleophilaceae bacterium]